MFFSCCFSSKNYISSDHNNAGIDDLDNNNFVDEKMFGMYELEVDNNIELEKL